MKTIRETRSVINPGRHGGRTVQDRVRQIEDNAEIPAGAIVVDNATAVHDWQTATEDSNSFGGGN